MNIFLEHLQLSTKKSFLQIQLFQQGPRRAEQYLPISYIITPQGQQLSHIFLTPRNF